MTLKKWVKKMKERKIDKKDKAIIAHKVNATWMKINMPHHAIF